MKYNDPGRMLYYTGQTEIELFLKLRSLIAQKKRQPSKKSNSIYKIKTCQGRNRMIRWNIPQNFFEF